MLTRHSEVLFDIMDSLDRNKAERLEHLIWEWKMLKEEEIIPQDMDFWEYKKKHGDGFAEGRLK